MVWLVRLRRTSSRCSASCRRLTVIDSHAISKDVEALTPPHVVVHRAIQVAAIEVCSIGSGSRRGAEMEWVRGKEREYRAVKLGCTKL